MQPTPRRRRWSSRCAGCPSRLKATSDSRLPTTQDPVQPSGESPFSPRRPTITHSDLHLSTELVSQAQSADTLPLAVERLLDAGADVNARDADSNTPLFLSVYVPDVRAALMVVHHLLRRGADPNSIRCGGTILNHALANRCPLLYDFAPITQNQMG